MPPKSTSTSTSVAAALAAKDVYHVALCFPGKNRVQINVKGGSTLHEIKKIALSALPALRSSSDDSAHLPGLDPSDLADLDLPNPAATSFPHSSTKSTTKSKSDIPADINSTAGFCLWKAKRRVFADDSNGTGGEGEFLGYESLEGDDLEIGEEEANEEEKRERKAALSVKVRDLTNPAWGRWNEVYVSFRDPKTGTFALPTPILPTVDDDEEGAENEGMRHEA